MQRGQELNLAILIAFGATLLGAVTPARAQEQKQLQRTTVVRSKHIVAIPGVLNTTMLPVKTRTTVLKRTEAPF